MKKSKTHKDIINLWPEPSIETLAHDLKKKYFTVAAWSRRKKIPSEHWPKIVTAAKKRKLNVTLEMLVETQLLS